MDMFSNLTLFWLVLAIVFLVLELVSLGLTTIWFFIGSLVAMIASMLRAPLWLQIVLCIVVSILTLLLIRPWVKNKFNTTREVTNTMALIGQKALVKTAIDNALAVGLVVVNGQEWSAKSVDDTVIPEGSSVIIKEIKGVHLVVEKEDK